MTSTRPLSVAPKPFMAKDANGLQDISPQHTLSTSKVWVLPPRPKPGRKPSTDTPSTKRKAQNRAAQRAFRERKARKVSELEVMLEERKADGAEWEKEMSQWMGDLGRENEGLRKEIELLRKELTEAKEMRLKMVRNQEMQKEKGVREREKMVRGRGITGITDHLPSVRYALDQEYICSGNPGSCMQCQRDSRSNLFCTTLAARTTLSKPSPQTQSTNNNAFIPVNKAYQTLSQHNGFQRANVQAVAERLEVDPQTKKVAVNSMNSVLRELDKKLYQ